MGSIVKPMFGEILRKTGSKMAGLFFVWSTLKKYLPQHIQKLLLNAIIQRQPLFKKIWDKILDLFSPYVHIKFSEIEEYRYHYAFAAIKTYLGEKVNSEMKNLKGKQMKENMALDLKRDDDNIEEEYEGVKMWWELFKCAQGKKTYTLTFHRSNWDVVTSSYLSYVMEEGKSIEARKNKKVKVFMNNPSVNFKFHTKGIWSGIDFEHPATFDTMAMDIEKKDEILRDLLAFRDGKEYYDRIGKTWKRGYLLYGPPGTEKSTMIAAMANLMKYNIYDLELTSIQNNWELKKLLIATTSKSIIVIEDIDCSLDLTGERNGKDVKGDNEGKKNEVTLSGLLNFIDGIWSACGQERILVFTTNHLGKLDQALIRRGRMDMHIELSYCTFGAFKILAKNYLNLDTHPLFEKIESLLEETKITPADVAEILMVKDRQYEVDGSLKYLIRALWSIKYWSQNATAGDEQQKKIDQI